MKKILAFLVLIAICSAFISSCAPASVTVKPAPVVRVRPVAPSPRHIWVSDGYVYRRGRYVHNSGYWAAPRIGYSSYIEGHWKQGRRGYVWVPGYWR
jgi:hypothetical protein